MPAVRYLEESGIEHGGPVHFRKGLPNQELASINGRNMAYCKSNFVLLLLQKWTDLNAHRFVTRLVP